MLKNDARFYGFTCKNRDDLSLAADLLSGLALTAQ